MKYNLSEITEVIKNRRSIFPEQYSERKVAREIIEKMLNNAIWAPTHGMTQPWRFKVFMEDGLKKLSDNLSRLYRETTPAEKFMQSKFDNFVNRPLKSGAVIAICMQRQETEKIKEIEEVEAVACAVHNMHLTLTAYGIGGYWSTGGATYTEEMKTFLGLGAKDKCLGFFYVGYPAIEWPKASRKPIEYVTEWITE
ncbi:MAG TPA: nitroreductase [Flavobacteriales bacterium]|nr:nitroreductase [Flavobacteriales bacterium]